MSAIVVIPARLESIRLPEKVLLDLGGKPVLEHVWSQALKARAIQEVAIATDSEKIRVSAEGWGAKVLMTSPECPNGTARIASILDQFDADFIINLQGDEPFMEPALLDSLVEVWRET
ncbi:MAG: cytidylyltransferase domain-containing protein, partial [Puniceicoccales bacterium]